MQMTHQKDTNVLMVLNCHLVCTQFQFLILMSLSLRDEINRSSAEHEKQAIMHVTKACTGGRPVKEACKRAGILRDRVYFTIPILNLGLFGIAHDELFQIKDCKDPWLLCDSVSLLCEILWDIVSHRGPCRIPLHSTNIVSSLLIYKYGLS